MADRFIDDVSCPIPGCISILHLTWTRSRPFSWIDLKDPRPLEPNAAYTGTWQVECENGHIVMVPDPVCLGDCPDPDVEHDHDDELRRFTAADGHRLRELAHDMYVAGRPT